MANISVVRGMRDIHSEDAQKFNFIVDTAQKISTKYNFQTIFMPILENSSLFERQLGEESDIVSKEIYKFVDKGDNTLALRPEFTASNMRFVIEQGLYYGPFPKKYFSYGPIFRYERPQKGRYRQAHQLNFEIYGGINSLTASLYLNMISEILSKIGIKDFRIDINHLGMTKEIRQNFTSALVQYLAEHQSSLSEDSQRRLKTNPLRILDSKDQKDKDVLLSAPSIKDFFTENEDNFINYILENIKSQYNPHLVRGLDYYTGFVFEVIDTSTDASQSALCGGGEYNNMLSEMLGKENVKMDAFGFALGIDRLMNSCDASKIKTDQLCCIFTNEQNVQPIINTIQGILPKVTSFEVIQKNDQQIAKLLKKANQLNADYVAIVNENNIITLKDMLNGEQREVNLA